MELPKSCRLSTGAFMNDCRGDACVARIVASIHDCLPGDACVAPTTFLTRQRGGSPPWQAFTTEVFESLAASDQFGVCE